jgi:hypothetical protein
VQLLIAGATGGRGRGRRPGRQHLRPADLGAVGLVPEARVLGRRQTAEAATDTVDAMPMISSASALQTFPGQRSDLDAAGPGLAVAVAAV